MNPPFNPQQHFEKAVQAYQNGQLDQAERLLRELRKYFPRIDPVISTLGGVLVEQGKLKEATRLLENALKKNPKNVDFLINLSAAQKARKRTEEALKSIQKAEKLSPDRADVHYNKANILLEASRMDAAEQSFKKALQLDPTLVIALFNLGNLYVYRKDYAQAEATYRQLLDKQANYMPAIMNLGNVLADQGRTKEAISIYQQLIDTYPKLIDGYLLQAKLYLDNGNTSQAAPLLSKALGIDEKNVQALVLSGNMEREIGNSNEAIYYFEKALELDPDNESAHRNLRSMQRGLIPGWHFVMLADDLRNSAYQQVIEKVVDADSVVLDIGTGSGLLAMMAARAGARQVVACEMLALLAQTAQKIVKANGYEEQITVYPRKSTELRLGHEMPQKANVILSEILDVGGVGEGVLPSIRHAVSNLATEDVRIIPSGMQLQGFLIEIPSRSKVCPVNTIAGFDLSLFNRFQVAEEYKSIHLHAEDHRQLSAPLDLIEYNFYQLPMAIQEDQPAHKKIRIPILADGELQGLVFWFNLNLDEETMVSSRQNGELKHWGQALCCFQQPRTVKAGEEVEVKMIYSDLVVRFELV